MLHNKYGIQIIGEHLQNEHVYFHDAHHHYVTMRTDNKKDIYLEQAALAHYLIENGFYQTTQPIVNTSGDWFTEHQGERILVLRIIQFQREERPEHGKQLAHFHQLNKSYPYEPEHLSSYGAWRELWIDKLTVFEQQIEKMGTENNHPFYKQLRDILPYVVGISENAIQYVHETGLKAHFNESDQGTVTFQRYQKQLMEPTISLSDLAYDHLTRDLAEYIRGVFLERENDSLDIVKRFLSDYESVQTLSAFGWRLLYARLAYPIHFFDVIAKGFNPENLDTAHQKLWILIKAQPIYEKKLKHLYDFIGSDYKIAELPKIQWL